ncbi:MAG: hypothetical protein HY015_09230 [Bacteroidetes bacterium]|nr:hypothetical protein [Bacteroidota bacterium]
MKRLVEFSHLIEHGCELDVHKETVGHWQRLGDHKKLDCHRGGARDLKK